MNKTPLYVAGGAVILLGLGLAWRFKRTVKNLEAITRGTLANLTWKEVTIRIDTVLKNPTNGNLKIKFPFVKVKHKDFLIGSSTVQNKDLEIPAHGELKIDNLFVVARIADLEAVAGEFFDYLLGKRAEVAVDVEVISQLQTAAGSIPIPPIKEQIKIGRA